MEARCCRPSVVTSSFEEGIGPNVQRQPQTPNLSMYVRDRLRVALAQRRARPICWSCALFQNRSIQTVTVSTTHGFDSHSTGRELSLSTPKPAAPRIHFVGSKIPPYSGLYDSSGSSPRRRKHARNGDESSLLTQNVLPDSRAPSSRTSEVPLLRIRRTFGEGHNSSGYLQTQAIVHNKRRNENWEKAEERMLHVWRPSTVRVRKFIRLKKSSGKDTSVPTSPKFYRSTPTKPKTEKSSIPTLPKNHRLSPSVPLRKTRLDSPIERSDDDQLVRKASTKGLEGFDTVKPSVGRPWSPNTSGKTRRMKALVTGIGKAPSARAEKSRLPPSVNTPPLHQKPRKKSTRIRRGSVGLKPLITKHASSKIRQIRNSASRVRKVAVLVTSRRVVRLRRLLMNIERQSSPDGLAQPDDRLLKETEHLVNAWSKISHSVWSKPLPRFTEPRKGPSGTIERANNASTSSVATRETILTAPASIHVQAQETTMSDNTQVQNSNPEGKMIQHPTSSLPPPPINQPFCDVLQTTSRPKSVANVHASCQRNLLGSSKSFAARLLTTDVRM